MNEKISELALSISKSKLAVSLYLEKYAIEEARSLRKLITVNDCKENLVEIEKDKFYRFSPHQYTSCGASYPRYSPFHLRSGVYQRLLVARDILFKKNPNYRLAIFDAYRPLSVQEYMVEHTFKTYLKEDSLELSDLSPEQIKKYYDKVFLVWTRPEDNLLWPPPHSTGSAIDLTIIDQNNNFLNMGAEIDALPPEGLPHHFLDSQSSEGKLIHQNRELLNTVMTKAGFLRIFFEWWHFSYGDQYWALLRTLEEKKEYQAVYSRVE